MTVRVAPDPKVLAMSSNRTFAEYTVGQCLFDRASDRKISNTGRSSTSSNMAVGFTPHRKRCSEVLGSAILGSCAA